MRFGRVIVSIVLFVAIANGCQQKMSSKMIVNGDLPKDRSELHPWIAGMLDQDSDFVADKIRQRVTANASPMLAPLIDYIAEFVPTRLDFVEERAFLTCLRRTTLGQRIFHGNDFLVFAQPLPDEVIEERVHYFDEELRPIMREFLSKFAGFGSEIEGKHAGQFSFNSFPPAKIVAYYDPEELGDWKDARVLYHSSVGDLLLINNRGETAWHEFTEGEIVPLFNSFELMVKHFVELHRSCTETSLDSWSSRELLRRSQQ